MRELKFRYTYKRKSDGKIWQEIVPIECLEGKGDKPSILGDYSDQWELIARDEYTGLKDKNGKEIYEGDMVKTSLSDTQHFLGVVKWSQNGYCYTFSDKRPDFYYIKKSEVIGNIYENPELLEETTK